jgi:beta-glucosidase
MSSSTHLIRPDVEERVNQLLSQMTLEEKIGQTNQVAAFQINTPEDLRQARISSVIVAAGALTGEDSSGGSSAENLNQTQREAVNGSRLGIPLLFGRDVIHGYRTIFPIPLAQAAAWSPDLVRDAAAVAAREASAHGIKWTFTPMIDIARDARWGRIAEGFGEDPHLASVLAAAAVQGYQGEDMAAPDRIVACAKHYLGYGAAVGGRDYEEVEMSVQTMRDVYLPPYRAAVEAGVGTLMSAFHDMNGVPIAANRQLLTDLLRDELGFRGFVVSDWDAVGEMVKHGVVDDQFGAAAAALHAGVDMDMVSGAFSRNVEACLQQGRLAPEEIDEAVRRILRIKALAGLFERPYTDPGEARKVTLTAENRELARRAAAETMVLLKNEGDLLPLGERFRKIALVGPLANAQGEMMGAWSPDAFPGDVIPLSDGVRSAAPQSVSIYDAVLPDISVRLAQECEVAVVVVGEHSLRSGENRNVADLGLPPGQRKLVEAVADQGVPIVLVVLAGRPLAIPRESRLAQAVLYAWHPGIEGGPALGELLFGGRQPMGRLPVCMPRATGQVPIYYSHKNSGRPTSEGVFAQRYLDQLRSPLYSFGYGLSYTTFAYTNLSISGTRVEEALEVRAEVTNTGNLPGVEIAQLYLRDLVGSVTRPVKELKGFQRLNLQPGETHQVAFRLIPADLAFSGRDGRSTIEPGRFHVWVGPHCAEGLQGEFDL